MANTVSVEVARKELMYQVLRARTPNEIKAAEQALLAWLDEYPEETGMRAGFEQLAMMQEALEIESVTVAFPLLNKK